jgi:hypothetical protein
VSPATPVPFSASMISTPGINRIGRKMPELPQDVMDIDGAEGFFARHSSPSDLPRLRPRLRSIVKLLMNSRAGIAGVPNQRLPAGTSDM